jgi:hypothetical protein
MIRIGDKDTVMAYIGNRALSAIYRGANLVWTTIQYISAWVHKDAWRHGEPW